MTRRLQSSYPRHRFEIAHRFRCAVELQVDTGLRGACAGEAIGPCGDAGPNAIARMAGRKVFNEQDARRCLREVKVSRRGLAEWAREHGRELACRTSKK